MNIKYDKYSGRYFLAHTDSNVVSLSFEEVEELYHKLREICMEQYELAIQFEPMEDCEGGACKI